MTGFTVAWIVWAGMFVVVEGIALVNKSKDDTLSEHVWSIFKVRQQPTKWSFARFFLAAFMVWLSGHFVLGWWA